MNFLATGNSKRWTARFGSVRDDAFRFEALITRQLCPQFQGCSRVATFLNHDAENITLGIYGAPQEQTLSSNLADHPVELPARQRRLLATAKVGGTFPTDLHCPGTDRLIADVDAAMSEHLFSITKAERETKVAPRRPLNDGRRESDLTERDSRHWTAWKANSRGLSKDRFTSVSQHRLNQSAQRHHFCAVVEDSRIEIPSRPA
jgi:hypothetical protein